MPTFSTINHALQFGNYGQGQPTVTVVGTDTDGYIIYDMSAAISFQQFAPNTKYLAGQLNFSTPFILTPGIAINPANSNTAAALTAIPGVEFFVDQGDVTISSFKISAISSSTPQFGAQVLVWSYQVGGQQVGTGGGGTVTSVATDSTLTGGPITTSGTLGINLNNANTWVGIQSFIANVGIGTASPGFLLDIGSGTSTAATALSLRAGQTAAVSAANTGTIRYNASLQRFETSSNGAVYAPLGGSGVSGVRVISMGFASQTNSSIPQTISAINFDPNSYSGFTTIKLRAIAACGNNTVNGFIKLRDITNSVDIFTFTVTGVTADTLFEQTLTVLAPGPGTIANNPVIYELRIYTDGSVGVTNYLQLYSAELRVA